ncbi:SGNH/GDSL hydrolase family protein [Sinosporangium siamense]|uniref:Lipase n=1 Tax=Sinosporangium siamense TaxID=1367973 RepID=A0A919V8B0_9ACTN|nr:SGNH/GDSL hydrolase family protein [Sinosporangium siamense]GII95955.1 lipase [Sinosporangium siamense]
MPGSRVRAALVGVAVCAMYTTIAAAAPSTRAYSWVALGDSFTAGVVQAAGKEFEPVRDGCARTSLAYPQVIADRLGAVLKLTNVSCANARISHIAKEEQEPAGRHAPPISADPDRPFGPVAVQLDAVRPNTNLVSVGVGSGTLGFGDILVKCMELGAEARGEGSPCKTHFQAELPRRLTELREQYDEMLTAIHDKAPYAKVITVGYPYIIPHDAKKCVYGSFTGFGTITWADLAWLRTRVLEPLNTAISQVTEEQGDIHVDLYEPGRKHSVCDKANGQNWVDGLYSRYPDSPALIHPNAKGHADTANRVEDALLIAVGLD